MNNTDTLLLHGKGHKAWNDWAGEMLFERERLETGGHWDSGDGSAAEAWRRRATADFNGHHFTVPANFDNFVFPGGVSLKSVHFSGGLTLRRAKFQSDVDFGGAVFLGAADFSVTEFFGASIFADCVFEKNANFTEAQFFNKAWFAGAKFNAVTFDNASFSGDVTFSDAIVRGDATFLGLKVDGEANFFATKFQQSADFSRSCLTTEVRFLRAEFTRQVEFDAVRFVGPAFFSSATFKSNAIFSNARFCDRAEFNSATFKSTALFSSAAFRNKANFNQVKFEGYTDFTESRFLDEATFLAINGESQFTLQSTIFQRVPDFQQAHFAEAPRLDIARIASPTRRSENQDVSGRWRALKRLAVQAHDHEREQIFFAEEIKALRGKQDRLLPNPTNFFRENAAVWPGGARYWAGLCYQGFSDFGRSMLRPIVWWLLAMTCAADYHLSRHLTMSDSGYGVGALNWLWHSTFGLFDYHGAQPALSCLAGSGEPISAAFHLAIRNGLVLPGLGGSEKLTQSYLCLYGEKGGLPVLPDAVVYVGLGQAVFSTLLIFLFLMAVRNHFRIK